MDAVSVKRFGRYFESSGLLIAMMSLLLSTANASKPARKP
jgi:hypothetical protein